MTTGYSVCEQGDKRTESNSVGNVESSRVESVDKCSCIDGYRGGGINSDRAHRSLINEVMEVEVGSSPEHSIAYQNVGKSGRAATSSRASAFISMDLSWMPPFQQLFRAVLGAQQMVDDQA